MGEKRFVTGSTDKSVKLWVYSENRYKEKKIGEHSDWVRDVAFSGNVGVSGDMIASCGEDEKVQIFKNEGEDWKTKEIQVGVPAWRVSFS